MFGPGRYSSLPAARILSCTRHQLFPILSSEISQRTCHFFFIASPAS